MPAVERKFKRHIDSLAQIFDFIDQFVDEEKVADDARHAIFLAVDELFTNMVKYHPLNRDDISIRLSAEGQTMIVQLVDKNVDPFDMTKKADPDLSGSLDDRKPGGLGIFLTKQFIDDVEYQHQDRTSTIVLNQSRFVHPPYHHSVAWSHSCRFPAQREFPAPLVRRRI